MGPLVAESSQDTVSTSFNRLPRLLGLLEWAHSLPNRPRSHIVRLCCLLGPRTPGTHYETQDELGKIYQLMKVQMGLEKCPRPFYIWNLIIFSNPRTKIRSILDVSPLNAPELISLVSSFVYGSHEELARPVQEVVLSPRPHRTRALITH